MGPPLGLTEAVDFAISAAAQQVAGMSERASPIVVAVVECALARAGSRESSSVQHSESQSHSAKLRATSSVRSIWTPLSARSDRPLEGRALSQARHQLINQIIISIRLANSPPEPVSKLERVKSPYESASASVCLSVCLSFCLTVCLPVRLRLGAI